MVEKKPYKINPSSIDIDKAVNTIRNSKKPLIITGRGALKAVSYTHLTLPTKA